MDVLQAKSAKQLPIPVESYSSGDRILVQDELWLMKVSIREDKPEETRLVKIYQDLTGAPESQARSVFMLVCLSEQKPNWHEFLSPQRDNPNPHRSSEPASFSFDYEPTEGPS